MPANPLMFGGNIARAERAQNRKNPVSHASLPPARKSVPTVAQRGKQSRLRSQESREYAESVKSELIMVLRASVLTAMLIAGLATAPIALADNRHGHEQWHGSR